MSAIDLSRLSDFGLMVWNGIVNFRNRHEITKAMTHRRIEAYYMKGHALYLRLANNSTIPAEELRQLVADEWVNPTTEYLRGTLGESKAWYYLSIRDERPDEKSVARLGYQKALARKRILSRLDRLRRLTAEI